MVQLRRTGRRHRFQELNWKRRRERVKESNTQNQSSLNLNSCTQLPLSHTHFSFSHLVSLTTNDKVMTKVKQEMFAFKFFQNILQSARSQSLTLASTFAGTKTRQRRWRRLKLKIEKWVQGRNTNTNSKVRYLTLEENFSLEMKHELILCKEI